MTRSDDEPGPLVLAPGASNLDIALELAMRIPHGRWTSYGELGEAAGRISGNVASGWTIANGLLHRHGAPWHRLRNKDGVFNGPANAVEGSPQAAEERCDRALVAEGCAVTLRRADPARFVSAAELLRVAGSPTVMDRLDRLNTS